MHSNQFLITGEDFRAANSAAFKAEQAELKRIRDARSRDLQIALQTECDAFISEYRAAYECGHAEADSECDRHIIAGQTAAEQITRLYSSVISENRKQDADKKARAAFYESALEGLTEAMDDRERANVIAAMAHVEWFRNESVDVPAYGKARTDAILRSKGAA